MNRRRFLNVLTGAMVATVSSLGARQSFAGGHGALHHAAHHQHEKAHVHHAAKEHRHDEEPQDSNYHHRHDDYGDHHHDCRLTGKIDAQTGHHRQECQDHDGGWESD